MLLLHASWMTTRAWSDEILEHPYTQQHHQHHLDNTVVEKGSFPPSYKTYIITLISQEVSQTPYGTTHHRGPRSPSKEGHTSEHRRIHTCFSATAPSVARNQLPEIVRSADSEHVIRKA